MDTGNIDGKQFNCAKRIKLLLIEYKYHLHL